MSIALLAAIFSCHSEVSQVRKNDNVVLGGDNEPYRCGIIHFHLYSNDLEKKVYPDLGLLLANAEYLKLNDDLLRRLEERAKNCTQICRVKKAKIRAKEQTVNRLAQEEKFNKNPELLTKKLNTIESMREAWLNGHKKRYEAGVRLLPSDAFMRWVPIENTQRSFDSELGP